ncbi:MAG: sulfite exporter TauE/SafE family protein, partial [Pedobacter sp.]|nr:sulfite exporter TauE/SafE family protein [Pedobacter sp.]
MSVLLFTIIVLAGAFLAGLVGSLTGLGGGVIIIPLLTLVLGVDIHYAIG